jgi:flagellar basal-body rod modification protein FlgD
MTVSTTTANPLADYSTATNSASAASSAAANSSGATQAYNTFLTMLTTELQNQDPLNPVDSTQFTSQLIDLTSVDELLTIGSAMSSVTSDLSSMSLGNAVNYIGKNVEASGSTATLQNDSASWSYDLSGAAAATTLTITNSSGATVWSGAGDTASGNHTLNWDGINNAGTQLTSGTYTLGVSATDSSGNAVSTSTSISGTVTGVDSSSGTTELIVNGVDVPLSSITQVTAGS